MSEQIDDINIFPKKDDKIVMFNPLKKENEIGTVLDDDFIRVQWDDGDVEEWCGMWASCFEMGARIIKQ